MQVEADAAPTPNGAPMALFGTWRVGSPDRQQAAVAAVEKAWRARPWPGDALRAYGVLAGDDGDTLLHLSLADRPDAAARQDLTWKREVDAAVPGIDRVGVTACRHQRSTPAYRDAADARCAVLVTRELDDADPDNARDLVETLFTSTADTPPADGLVAAHFYVGLDGSRVFNYALWTSVDAHQHAIEHRPADLETTPAGSACTPGPDCDTPPSSGSGPACCWDPKTRKSRQGRRTGDAHCLGHSPRCGAIAVEWCRSCCGSGAQDGRRPEAGSSGHRVGRLLEQAEPLLEGSA